MKYFFLLISLLLFFDPASAQLERLFASYFDIEVGAKAGDSVWGKVHLESNKDVARRAIPSSYRFEIVSQQGSLFEIESERDPSGRFMGRIVVAPKQQLPSAPTSIVLTVALYDRATLITQCDIQVNVVEQTLWSTLYNRYLGDSFAQSRFYGSKSQLKEKNFERLIADLQANAGRFSDVECYTTPPEQYPRPLQGKSIDKLGVGAIEYDWSVVTSRLGALGYAYARSEIYGRGGDAQKHAQLKDLLYDAILEFTRATPIEGTVRLLGGKPIGEYMGDGFMALADHNLLSHQVATHHWTLTDPMVGVALPLLPDLLEDLERGDERAVEIHNNLINFFQISSSIVSQRRAIDDPTQRWGELQDTIRSSGAWSDANLGHRSRTLLALPIIWADYNRPMTYVQYWYEDYYNGKPFEGFTLSRPWSPNGVLNDLQHWLTKYTITSQRYGQSGFHPDGTISHHIGHGSDAAMVAYGFEWLTDPLNGYKLYKGTQFAASKEQLQFIADRLLGVYPNLIYRGRMDFLVSGRSFATDLEKFVDKSYLGAVEELLETKEEGITLSDEAELKKVARQIARGEFEQSATTPYWVNEFLVHRRGGGNEPSFYASLKLKSERTVGIEDFSSPRKSWHGASGVLALRVEGDEYADDALSSMDWHLLPGITEEWRTDPLPAQGGAAAAGCGQNTIAGVLSDSKVGMAIYHHDPKESYSSANAHKSYYFLDDKIVAMGSAIEREHPGMGASIYTCVDQARFDYPITYAVDGAAPRSIAVGESVAISERVERSAWFHTGSKGYIIVARTPQKVDLRSGSKINITDPKAAAQHNVKNYILAIDHGVNPQASAEYLYILLPNATAAQMPALLERYVEDLSYSYAQRSSHSLYSREAATRQVAFFEATTTEVGGVEISADRAAILTLRETGALYRLSVANPAPAPHIKELTFRTSLPLKAGRYHYRVGGLYPIEGEWVSVSEEGSGSKIVVELPDGDDQQLYNYQADLYNATSIVVDIPKR